MRCRTASYVAAAGAGFVALLFAAPSWGESPRSLGDVFRDAPRAAPAPPVARYVVEQGPVFVLDRTSATALLKFDNDEEIWVLQARPTSRGDVVYVNDAGQIMLRATRLGGLTMFTPDRPQGAPVALRGGASPLPTEIAMTPALLVRRLNEAGDRIARLAPNFESMSYGSDNVAAPLVAQAARLAADVIEEDLRARRNTGAIAKLKRLVVRDGPAPSVKYEAGVLVITVTPKMGVAGRPSSERIRRAFF